jgi:hypothetical protein
MHRQNNGEILDELVAAGGSSAMTLEHFLGRNTWLPRALKWMT